MDNDDGKVKNLSARRIWSLCFLNGKDAPELLQNNLKGVYQAVKNLISQNFQGKSIIPLFWPRTIQS